MWLSKYLHISTRAILTPIEQQQRVIKRSQSRLVYNTSNTLVNLDRWCDMHKTRQLDRCESDKLECNELSSGLFACACTTHTLDHLFIMGDFLETVGKEM